MDCDDKEKPSLNFQCLRRNQDEDLNKDCGQEIINQPSRLRPTAVHFQSSATNADTLNNVNSNLRKSNQNVL